MRILVVIPYYSSVYGGNTRVVKELYQCFGHFDVDIDLITTDADLLQKLDVPLNTWIQKNNYRVRYFSCFHRGDLTLSLDLLAWLNENLKSYDLVHTHNRFSPLVTVCEQICKMRHVPYVSTLHGMLEPWAMAYKAWKKRLYFPIFDRPMLQKASALHVLTRNEAENIRHLGIHTPATVIANGIHRSDFEPMAAPEVFWAEFPELKDKTLLLFLGRLEPQKGLDLLAPAFAKVHAQFPQTQLAIAGPKNPLFLDTVQGYFEAASCLEAVTFTGMLSGDLKYAALAAATVYVAPYYSEGFSMSVLEGMAAGLPAVITTGCNFPEAGDAGVAKVVAPDSNAIAEGVLQQLSDLQTAKMMGKRAREFIFQSYTWDAAAHKLYQLYTQVLE